MRTPALSIVLVTRRDFAALRRTVAALRAQTVRSAIELLVVCPRADAVSDRRPEELMGFHRVEIVPVGHIRCVDHAVPAGVERATAPVVASVEDHVRPEPTWAAEILRAHEGPWAVVGGRLVNENPRSGLSWANVMISHPEVRAEDGEVVQLSSHNATYKRSALLDLEGDLVKYMGREGNIMGALRARGHRIYVASSARYAHQQISSWRPQTAYRFASGRNYAGTRARREEWGRRRRLLYAIGGPLIPVVRCVRLVAPMREAGVLRRAFLPLVVSLVIDAAGECAGYLGGHGRSLETMSDYEVERERFLSARDRRDLAPA